MFDFFQSMFDTVAVWWTDFVLFISNSWDMLLYIAIAILAFFVFKLLRYLTVPAIILGQILLLTALVTGLVAYVALIMTSLVSVYNLIFETAGLINNYGGGCIYYFISQLGVSGVLASFFTEVFAVLVTVIIIRTSGLFFWAMNLISDKIWKIGVLLGLL